MSEVPLYCVANFVAGPSGSRAAGGSSELESGESVKLLMLLLLLLLLLFI